MELKRGLHPICLGNGPHPRGYLILTAQPFLGATHASESEGMGDTATLWPLLVSRLLPAHVSRPITNYKTQQIINTGLHK